MIALVLAILLMFDGPGFIEGDVVQCINGQDQLVADATVSIDGQSGSTTSDLNGHFTIPVLIDGTLTVTARSSDKTGHRWYVPNMPGETLDVGGIELGDPVSDCG